MKQGLEERLQEHPELRDRFEKILDIVENSQGDCVLGLQKIVPAAERAIVSATNRMSDSVSVGPEGRYMPFWQSNSATGYRCPR